jgi:hypothetical protein
MLKRSQQESRSMEGQTQPEQTRAIRSECSRINFASISQ